jgi:hypothetical protein
MRAALCLLSPLAVKDSGVGGSLVFGGGGFCLWGKKKKKKKKKKKNRDTTFTSLNKAAPPSTRKRKIHEQQREIHLEVIQKTRTLARHVASPEAAGACGSFSRRRKGKAKSGGV